MHGFCALHNELEKNSQIQVSWKHNQRRKNLKFVFRQNVAKLDELQWQLASIVYSEKYKGF